MLSSQDFDHFLKKGFIEGLPPGASMNVLLSKFGDDNWAAKHVEFNGLVYGIIQMGFIEFHIYNECISGISYRPGLPYPKKDFKHIDIPWISNNRSIQFIENTLSKKEIIYKRYAVTGPLKTFSTAGGDWFGLEQGEHIFIDTEGGVTFVFEENQRSLEVESYKICKYYGLEKIK